MQGQPKGAVSVTGSGPGIDQQCSFGNISTIRAGTLAGDTVLLTIGDFSENINCNITSILHIHAFKPLPTDEQQTSTVCKLSTRSFYSKHDVQLLRSLLWPARIGVT